MHGGSLCGHVRDLGGDRWELVVNLPRRPGQKRGDRPTKRVTCKGVRRAEASLRAWISELEQHACTDPETITLGEILRRWLELEAAHNARPKTLERYAQIVDKHLTPDLGSWPVADLRAADLSAYYLRKQESGRLDGRGGLSAQTARHLHAVIRAALTWAQDEGLIDENPAGRVKHPPRAERAKRAVWTPAQISRAIAEASRNRVRIPAALAGFCGLRRSEVCALQWSDVDLERGLLAVRHSVEQTRSVGGRPSLHFGPPKSPRARRVVPVPRHLVDLLVAHRREQDAMHLAAGRRWNARDLVCCRPDGEPTRPQTLTTTWAAFVADHHLEPRLDFHGLRRSYISGLHDRGASDRLMMDWAGHESVQTTHEHYTAAFSEAERQAILRLDQAIDAAQAEIASAGAASNVVSLAAARGRRRS